MKLPDKYTFRVITDPEMLTEAFRLRYTVYSKTFPELITNQNHKVESDIFDTRSINLGMYIEYDDIRKLICYCRLILPECYEHRFSHLLVRNHPHYLQQTQKTAAPKIASIKWLPAEEKEIIGSCCTNMESENLVYTETSRFIIHEEHRGLTNSSLLVSNMFEVCNALNIRYSFFTCSHHHVSFYSRYGLTLFPGISPFENEFFGEKHVLFGTALDFEGKHQHIIKNKDHQLALPTS